MGQEKPEWETVNTPTGALRVPQSVGGSTANGVRILFVHELEAAGIVPPGTTSIEEVADYLARPVPDYATPAGILDELDDADAADAPRAAGITRPFSTIELLQMLGIRVEVERVEREYVAWSRYHFLGGMMAHAGFTVPLTPAGRAEAQQRLDGVLHAEQDAWQAKRRRG